MYFACVGEKEENKDGEMLFFRIPKDEVKYYDSDTVSVIANVAWCPADFEIAKQYSLDDKAFHNINNHHALHLIHQIKQEKPYFLEKIQPQHLQSILCVRPKLDNPRVIRQDGAFFLFGITDNKYAPAQLPDRWRIHPDEKRYIIKSTDKISILKQLASVGISRAKLFPEIDNVSQFIKNDFGLTNTKFESTIQDFSPFPITIHWS